MGEIIEPHEGVLLQEALADIFARFDLDNPVLRRVLMASVLWKVVHGPRDASMALNFIESFADINVLRGQDRERSHEIIDVLRVLSFGLDGDQDAMSELGKAARRVIATSSNPKVLGFAEVTRSRRLTDKGFAAELVQLVNWLVKPGERPPPGMVAPRVALALAMYPRGNVTLSDIPRVEAAILAMFEEEPWRANETVNDVLVRAVAVGLGIDRKAARGIIKSGADMEKKRARDRKKAARKATD